MRHRMFVLGGLVAGALMFSAGLAQAQSGRAYQQWLLSKMHQVNLDEMEMGELAITRGQAPEVREFGRQLFREHRRNDRLVRSVARQEGIALLRPWPRTQAERVEMRHHQRVHRELRYLRGRAFDEAFLRAMAEGHGDVVQTLRQARATLRRGPVRDLVGETIPVVREHRRIARNLESQI